MTLWDSIDTVQQFRGAQSRDRDRRGPQPGVLTQFDTLVTHHEVASGIHA